MVIKTRAALFLLLGYSALTPGQTIIDDSFDDNVVTGWSSIGNILLADHTITEQGTLLTSTVVGTEANLNTHRGIVSDTSFDPADLSSGFTLTFEVASQGETDPGANGLFLGLTSSDETFFRTEGVLSFGFVFYGLPSRTDSDFGVSLVTNDIGAGGPAAEGLILSPNPNTIELASLQDGFTAVVTADPNGWTFSVEGVNDLTGQPGDLSKSGTWADAGTTYQEVFGGASEWFVLASNQGNPVSDTHTVVYDRIALTTGQPGTTPLAIKSIEPSLAGAEPSVTLTWDAVSGVEYALDVATDLSGNNWSEITDSLTTTGTEIEYTHQILPDFSDLLESSSVFYRVRQLGASQ